MPEACQRLGHRQLLIHGQSASELPLDEPEVVLERVVVAPPSFWREEDADAASIVGDRLAPHQPGRLDAVDESGEAAPREERPLFELLHPKPGILCIDQLGEDVEPGEREPFTLEEVHFCGTEDPRARVQDATPRLAPGRRGPRRIVVRVHARTVPILSLTRQSLLLQLLTRQFLSLHSAQPMARRPSQGPARGDSTMATMLIRHQVADYAAWRQRLRRARAHVQKAGGVTAEDVYQSVADPNDLTVTHDFATVEAAQAFLASAELQAAMHDAGVVGAPTSGSPARLIRARLKPPARHGWQAAPAAAPPPTPSPPWFSTRRPGPSDQGDSNHGNNRQRPGHGGVGNTGPGLVSRCVRPVSTCACWCATRRRRDRCRPWAPRSSSATSTAPRRSTALAGFARSTC